MTDKTIVILMQEDSTSGDVNEFDQARDAERYIEGLLEAGYARQSIRVMEAHGLNLEITPRPIVSLHAPTAPATPAAEAPAQEDTVEVVRAPASDAPSIEPPVEMAAPEPGWEPEPEPAGPETEPYTRNGVKFSSAFASER